MKNFIEYFYKIKIGRLNYNGKCYSFIYNNYMYKLYNVSLNINIDFIVNLDKILLNNTLISEIIVNANGKYISNFNNTNYVLLKIFVNPNKRLYLNELISFDTRMYTDNGIASTNWGLLWSKKIDYLEKLVNENGKKYPLISDSFNYFLGLSENAISYYNSIVIPKNYRLFISHHNLNFNLLSEEIYNPLNIFFDYIARDIGEYIKYSFFNNNTNIFNELNILINTYNLSLIDIKLIIARILYPSFYFNLYEDILLYNKDEKILLKIIENLDSYERYLANIINYFKGIYEIDKIDWLSNKY